tara:strand:+ start:269 stop:514 length:246 start_codon:yes stop_codon:yes gene_type:complete
MSASFVTDSQTKEREPYIDNIMEGLSKMECIRDNLDELSNNFTPTAKDKEKTDKILYHIKAALNLSEFQESEDGPGQGKGI